MEELNNNVMSIILSVKNNKGVLKQWGRKINYDNEILLLKEVLSSWCRTLQQEELQNEIAEHVKNMKCN